MDLDISASPDYHISIYFFDVLYTSSMLSPTTTSTPSEGQGCHVPILIVNPLHTDVTLYKPGTQMAKASPVEGLMVAPVGEAPSSSPKAPEVLSRKSIMAKEKIVVYTIYSIRIVCARDCDVIIFVCLEAKYC